MKLSKQIVRFGQRKLRVRVCNENCTDPLSNIYKLLYVSNNVVCVKHLLKVNNKDIACSHLAIKIFPYGKVPFQHQQLMKLVQEI